jgi:hypothetical protein
MLYFENVPLADLLGHLVMKGQEASQVHQVHLTPSQGNSEVEIWCQGAMSATGIDGQTEQLRQDSQSRPFSRQLPRQTTVVSITSHLVEQIAYF